MTSRGRHKRLVKLADGLSDHGASIATLLGTILVAAASPFLPQEAPLEVVVVSPGSLVLLVGLGLLVAGGFLAIGRERRVSLLETRLALLEDESAQRTEAYEESLVKELQTLAEKLGLGHNERITIFRHDGTEFVRLGRYSKNPVFMRPGRAAYPEREGVLFEAWQKGQFFFNGLPDPNVNSYEYYRQQKDLWNVPRRVAKKFAMKSRSYASYSLASEKKAPLGLVLVLESTRVECMDQSGITSIVHGEDGKRLCRFLEDHKGMEPSPKLARKEGL